MAETGQSVKLAVYDLSQGLARQIDGVWHTAIILGPTEHYYGGGLQQAPAGRTPFGAPVQTLPLGTTHLPQDIINDFLQEQRSVFTPQAYNLFDNNCNNFTDTFANFLVGSGIPSHITALPREVLATPFGQMIAPMLTQTVGQTLGNVHQPAPGAPAQPQPAAAYAAGPSLPRPSGVSTRPSGTSTASAAQRGGAQPVGIPSLGAGRGASGAGTQAQPSNSPATDATAAEIKQALAFTTADTGVPMEGGQSRAGSAAASATDNEAFRDLARTSSQLQRDPSAAASLAHSSPGPQSEGHRAPRPRDTPSQPAAAAVAQGAVGHGDLQERVKQEFQRLMAQGNLSADEAGVQALKTAMGQA